MLRSNLKSSVEENAIWQKITKNIKPDSGLGVPVLRIEDNTKSDILDYV